MKSILTILNLGKLPGGASWASVLACIIFGVSTNESSIAWLFVAMVLSVIAVNIEVEYAISDPKEVVLDEFLGMMVQLLIVGELHWYWIVGQLVIFRIVDILKPFPFNKIEQLMKNRYGVLVDDICIGLVLGALGLLVKNIFEGYNFL